MIDLSDGASGALVLSAIIAGAACSVECEGASTTFQPLIERQHAIFPSAGVGAMAALSLSGDGARVKRPKLEYGTTPTSYSPLPREAESLVCLSYYEQIGPDLSSFMPIANGTAISTTVIAGLFPLPESALSPRLHFTVTFNVLVL